MKKLRSLIKNDKYEGQALAVVMIVLVVAVIIGMAIYARTQSEQRKVADERSSEESATISDTVLVGIADTSVSEMAEIINDSSTNPTIHNLCNTDGNGSYDFLEDGCKLSTTSDVTSFLEYLDGLVVGDSTLAGISALVEDELVNECGDEAANISLDLSPVEEGEEITIENGQVFSLVSYDTGVPSGCNISVTASPDHEGSSSGIAYHATYFSPSAGYKGYAYSDAKAFCFFDCSTDSQWATINPTPTNNGWSVRTPPFTFTVNSILSGPYYLEELRLRAVKDDVRFSWQTSPNSCMELEEIIRARVSVTCGDTSRAKEVIVPKASWAPALFDSAIYNGSGVLDYDTNY